MACVCAKRRRMRAFPLLVAALLALPASAKPVPKKQKKKASVLRKVKVRRALDRKIAEQAGILGAMRAGSLGEGPASGFGGVFHKFKKADAAYERGDWGAAQALYEAADALNASAYGATHPATRYGHTCEARLHTACALKVAAKKQRTSMAFVLSGRRDGDRRSRLERALPDVLRHVERARRDWERGKLDDARAKYEKAFDRDPRCPGDRCPPWLLREIGELRAKTGLHARAAKNLQQYLKAIPKARDRKTVQAMIKTAVAAEKQAAADAKAALDARQLRLPTSADKAPWLRLGDAPAVGFRQVRFGGDTGIAQVRVGKFRQWWGMKAGAPVVGPLAIPNAFEWLAVGLDGAIYYARKDGSLHRAADLAAARVGFEQVARLPRARDWAVAGTTVIATEDRTIHISPDGGRTFTAYTHANDPGSTFVRADGVVVFGDRDGAWVSDDAGKTWQMTPLGDMRRMYRDGQRVYRRPSGPDRRLSDGANCAQGELTADLRWVVPSERSSSGRSHGWDTVFDLGAFARAPLHLADGTGRAARTDGADAMAEVKLCRRDPAKYFEDRRGGAAGMGGMGRRCKGLDCLVRPKLRPSPVRFGLLGDARKGAEGDKAPAATHLLPTEHRRRHGFSRRKGTPISSTLATPGTLVVARADFAGWVPPIADCDLRWVTSIGGVGLGACQGEPRQLVVLDAKGGLVERFAIPGAVQAAMLAEDGTIAVQVGGEDAPRAAIRRPIALGASDAWRIATVPGAEAWRPAPGGRAIALVPGSQAAPRLDVGTATLDGKWMSGWRGSVLEPIEACHAKAFAADPQLRGTVELIFDLDARGKPLRTSATNGLRGQNTGALIDCLLDATKSAYHGYKGGKARRSFSFAADLKSYRVVLSEVDGSHRPVTEDVTFEHPPQQFAVQADGTVRVTHSGYPQTTCVVPKAGEPLCPRKK